jgi:hypothetical protein
MRESVERETEGGGGSARANSVRKKAYFHHLDKVTTSFFFTNFPKDASTGDLWKLFHSFEKVGEVYIPKKKDKYGRRFEFVKFKEVFDVDVLSQSLKDVWMGSSKLWVNLSRFKRTEGKEIQPNSTPVDSKMVSMEERRSGRSYREALRGGVVIPQLLKVQVNEDLCKELHGGIVGKLAREKDVRRIQTTLYMEGYRSIKVTHMGGNMVLLRSPVNEDVTRLMKSKNECLSYYFSELKPWNPGLLSTHREVWVQVYGIPLHIWGENLFKIRWEEVLVANLLEILQSVTFSLEEDSWRWMVDEGGEFTVNTSYHYLVEELTIDAHEDGDVLNVLTQIWESPAPSKVIAFSWQLLLDRIPTRRNLEVRNILPLDTPWECLGCVGSVEDSTHLFLLCPCARWMWGKILNWMGVSIVFPPSLPLLFELVKGAARNAKIHKGFLLIWHASLWSIWKARNSSIFANGNFSPRAIVEEIKIVSWKWCLARLKVIPFMLYEWLWDLGDCLLR